jgi:hypothetical protein
VGEETVLSGVIIFLLLQLVRFAPSFLSIPIFNFFWGARTFRPHEGWKTIKRALSMESRNLRGPRPVCCR